MKRIIAGVLVFLMVFAMLPGCAEEKAKGAAINVTAIAGPTGVGLVDLMQKSADGDTVNTYTFNVVSDPTQAVAAITNGTADIAAVPTNLASTLYNKTKGKVQVLAVNTLGVLHIMERGNSVNSVLDLKGQTIYTDVKNKGANPEYILRYLLEKNNLNPDETVRIEFVAELDAVIASGEAKITLVPEPKASTYLMQDQNQGLRRALNVTEEWSKVSGEDSALMMGCVIARTEFIEKNPDAVNMFLDDYAASISVAKSDVEKAATLCETYQIIPKAAVARQAIPNCGLVYVSGNLMKTRLSAYLKVLFDYSPAAIGGTLPSDDFYYAG